MATRRKFLKALASTGTPDVSSMLAVEPSHGAARDSFKNIH